MNPKKEVIVLGAGAIGRGFLPWKFLEEYDFIFVDTRTSVVARMREAKGYITCRIRDHKVEKLWVDVKGAYLPSEFDPNRHREAAAVFINVGPRNVVHAASILGDIGCPIILNENDPSKVELLKKLRQFKNVCFAVPDVITSNTAPADLLEQDPLSVMTEDGILFIERISSAELKGDFVSCDSAGLHQQWMAKLYLHNTPHCIAAYLGALANVDHVHEAMDIAVIRDIVNSSMQEMLATLKLEWPAFPTEFLDWYAKKEIRRFCDKLLYDPVLRVAREPLRKLERDGRLIGAAQLCLSHGIIPNGILTGIVSAMLFDRRDDPDSHISFMKRALSHSKFLTHVLGLRKGEVLEMVLTRKLDGIIESLCDLQEKEGRRSLGNRKCQSKQMDLSF